MKQLQIGLLEKELTIYQIRHYECQMPETRRKLHQLAKHLVHDCEIPILQIAKELNVDRGKRRRGNYPQNVWQGK